jgi:hypothetical protein
MPFKEDLDRTPIDVLARMYGGGGGSVRGFKSVISLQISVGTTAQTLEEILLADETIVTDEDTGVAVDGTTWWFTGTIQPHSQMEIKPGTVEFTSATLTLVDDGLGKLSGTGATGTIDYSTGTWTIVADVTPPVGANWVVDYTWFYVLPEKVNGLWMYPAGDLRATFSSESTPTTAVGIPILGTELFELLGQPSLIRDAKFIAGASTDVDIEVFV